MILYGSLAKTGVGHGTEYIIASVLQPFEVRYHLETQTSHPNTMALIAYKNNIALAQMRIYSVGGGAMRVENFKNEFVIKSKAVSLDYEPLYFLLIYLVNCRTVQKSDLNIYFFLL